jgi:hypothetical protein
VEGDAGAGAGAAEVEAEGGAGTIAEDEEVDEAAIMAALGFAGFSTTKVLPLGPTVLVGRGRWDPGLAPGVTRGRACACECARGTQGKKVEDNTKTAAKGAAQVGKKRQYRQYMNRRLGPAKPK